MDDLEQRVVLRLCDCLMDDDMDTEAMARAAIAAAKGA